MKNNDEFQNALYRQAVKDIGLSLFANKPKTKEGGSVNDRLQFEILAALVCATREAVKIIFRKNFGKEGIQKTPLILCFLFFMAVAFLAFSGMNSHEDYAILSGSSDAHFITGMLFIIIGFYILIQGFVYRARANSENPYDYNGDSFLLGFLRKECSQEAIQTYFEPLVTIAIGLSAGFFFDWIAGIPIMLCGVSVWGYSFIGCFFIPKPLHNRAEQLNNKFNQPDQFTEIKTDL